MTSFIIQASVCLATISLLIGCDSNVVEKIPDGIIVQDKLLDVSSKNGDINEKIEKIDEFAKKIKRITDLLKKAYDKDSTPEGYSVVDLIIEINEELKSSLPQKSLIDGSYVKTSIIDIKSNVLSEECRRLETKLEARQSEDNNEIGVITYSVRNCSTKGNFVSVFSASWYQDSMLFSAEQDAILNILEGTARQTISAKLKCDVGNDGDGSRKFISKISCQNLTLKLSSSENALIENLVYDQDAEMQFIVNSLIMEEDKVKATLNIGIEKNGRPHIDLNKTIE